MCNLWWSEYVNDWLCMYAFWLYWFCYFPYFMYLYLNMTMRTFRYCRYWSLCFSSKWWSLFQHCISSNLIYGDYFTKMIIFQQAVENRGVISSTFSHETIRILIILLRALRVVLIPQCHCIGTIKVSIIVNQTWLHTHRHRKKLFKYI